MLAADIISCCKKSKQVVIEDHTHIWGYVVARKRKCTYRLKVGSLTETSQPATILSPYPQLTMKLGKASR
jgi:hypothetical protein